MIKTMTDLKTPDREVEEREIDFTSKDLYINTSIGTYDNKAYVVIWVPTTLGSDYPYLINSKGQRCEFNKDKLLGLGSSSRLVPTSRPMKFPRRWELEDIKHFLNAEQRSETPNTIFNDIVIKLREKIDYPDERYYSYVALWIIGTYFYQLFETYPFTYFGGVKGVGKTKSLDFIAQLAFNAVNSINITSSALFRLAQSANITLLVDEVGYLKNRDRKEELNTLLCSRYKKGQYAFRSEKDKLGNFEVKNFNVYGPSALASIEGLEDVLGDRAIQLIIKRTLNPKIANSEISDKDPFWQRVRNQLYRLYLVRFDELTKIINAVSAESAVSADTEQGKKLSGRSLELWRPILLLAKWIEVYQKTRLYQDMESLAIELQEEKSLEELSTWENMLVISLYQLVKEDSWYSVENIKTQMLTNLDQVPESLNNKWIGKAMTRLGFKEKKHKGKGMEYRLTPNMILNTAQRLNIPLSVTAQTTQTAQTAL